MTQTVPARSEERSKNPLRPEYLSDVIGQTRAVSLLARAIDASFRRQEPLPHVLLVGPSGTGKTTLAHVVANELGSDVWALAAPISFDTLAGLRTKMAHGDVLFIDEVHLQAIAERRGAESMTKPEVLFGIMEDRVLTTATGVLEYPRITLIAGTTDEGQLPDAFINRFPLRPSLDRYTLPELTRIAEGMARRLDVELVGEAANIFARACAGVPRNIGNFITNGRALCDFINGPVALEVLALNDTTEDGLTKDMQAMLRFLLTKARQENGDGDVKHQASLSTIATAIGKSRDVKAVALRVEPYLIEQGYIQVGHGGRRLTDAGIARARTLT